MLIDDRDLFRAGLKTLLEDAGIKVVAQCNTKDAPVHVAQGARADVILVDTQSETSASGDRGLKLIEALVTQVPQSAIVVLSASSEPKDVIGALRAGARGYVLKSLPVDVVAAHVELVSQGGVSLAGELLSIIVDHVRTGVIPGVNAGGELSVRELDVLKLVARGMDNNQIASELAISAKTVKNHLASIFVKLGVVNRVQAAVFAVKAGLG